MTVNSEMFGKGKTIVLVMPEHFSIFDMLIKNFQYYGFDVIYSQKNLSPIQITMKELVIL